MRDFSNNLQQEELGKKATKSEAADRNLRAKILFAISMCHFESHHKFMRVVLSCSCCCISFDYEFEMLRVLRPWTSCRNGVDCLLSDPCFRFQSNKNCYFLVVRLIKLVCRCGAHLSVDVMAESTPSREAWLMKRSRYFQNWKVLSEWRTDNTSHSPRLRCVFGSASTNLFVVGRGFRSCLHLSAFVATLYQSHTVLHVGDMELSRSTQCRVEELALSMFKVALSNACTHVRQ